LKYRAGILNYETEEVSHAKRNLISSLELGDPSEDDYLALSNVIQVTDANNHLCMIHFQREEFESAEQCLKAVETLYESYKRTEVSNQTSINQRLEEIYTTTTLFFAQVYGRLENTEQSAVYCQRTLKRKIESGNFDPNEIAQFCLQIASYYQMEERWFQALYVINAAETLLKKQMDEQRIAEIALFRAKFYSEYLESQHSKNGYVPSISEEVEEFNGLTLDDECPRPNLSPLVTDLQIDSWVSEAGQWFDKALSYFLLEGFTTEHVSIVLERDTMWSTSTQMGSNDRKRKKSILKRRASHLEPLVLTLSPNHFFSLVQQLLFTCGEICEQLVDLSELPLSDGLTVPEIDIPNYEEKEKKLNKFVVSGVQYYQKFLDTILGPEGKLPASLEEGVEESFFRSHLSLAKLHQRFRSRKNRRVIVMMNRKAASYYKLTETLGQAYKPKVLQRELAMCGELHKLLTIKADTIEASLK
jgi:tetratricopeptide (TPR) repeat protein